MHFDPFWNGLAKIQNELISGWQKNKNKNVINCAADFPAIFDAFYFDG